MGRAGVEPGVDGRHAGRRRPALATDCRRPRDGLRAAALARATAALLRVERLRAGPRAALRDAARRRFLDARRPWTLAGLAAVLSFCVQAHAGLAVVGLAVAVVGIGSAWPLPRTAWLRAALVTAALWAIPLVHEYPRAPGQPRNDGPVLPGTRTAARILASRDSGIWGDVLAGPLLPSWQVLEGEVPAATSVAVPMISSDGHDGRHVRRGRPRASRRLPRGHDRGGRGGRHVGGPIAAHGIVGALSDYLLAWAPAVGAVDLAVVLAALASLVTPTAFDWSRLRRPLLATVLLAWAVIGGHRLIGKHADQARDTTMRALATDVRGPPLSRVTRPVLGFDLAAWQESRRSGAAVRQGGCADRRVGRRAVPRRPAVRRPVTMPSSST